MHDGYAVFHDHGNHWASRFLRPGFRHVFAVVQADGHWVRIDAMNGVPVVEIVAGADYDIAGFYRGEGFKVVPVNNGKRPRGLLVWGNCVGLCKAVFGLKSRALTPHQLYRFLER